MNPYQQFVSAFAALAEQGKSLPLGNVPSKKITPPPRDAPNALFFSPHPDDECISGGLALRLMREMRMRLVNVAVTLGSNQERRQARLAELKNACRWIGFELEETGLDQITTSTRDKEPRLWEAAIRTIAAILLKYSPRVIFFPHDLDWNRTHIGVHLLLTDALKSLPRAFSTIVIETEFWGQMATPNLMVELSAADVADMLAALSFHVGEVQRNPYHVRLPAWLQDNVRRGAEIVGGQGGLAPNFLFAALYRARKWENGDFKELFTGGKQLSANESPEKIWL